MNKLTSITTQFEAQLGYVPDLVNPRSFNEKLQWLKLFYHDPLLTRCADKITAKDYVREKVGRDICIPTLRTYGCATEFKPEELPDQFILKLNNGSGKVSICEDKRLLDVEKVRQELSAWLQPSSNQYFYSYEWCYRDIGSRVIAEPLIGAPDSLVDYKFFCFNGEPRCLITCTNRTRQLHVDFFDTQRTRLPFNRHHPNSPHEIPRPSQLEEMLAIAKALSADFPFVRVDLYCQGSRIYFGELTFYPGNGMEHFEPVEWDYTLGEWLTLPDHALISPRSGLPSAAIPREHFNSLIELLAWQPLDAPAAERGDDPEECERLRAKMDQMQRSFSWRVTSPLRALRRLATAKR